MAFLLIAAATGFMCATPVHRDGVSIRCGESSTVMSLQGVKAYAPGGPCYRPDDCPEDIGRLAQDYLAGLTRGQKIMCTPVRGAAARGNEVRCTAGGKDLSCAMLASGLTKPTGTALGCPPVKSTPKLVVKPASRFAGLEELMPWVIAALVIVNILTLIAFLEDRRRAKNGLNRVADLHLLALVLFGGGLGGFAAQQLTGHLRDEEPFASQLVVLLGLQIGAAIGFFAVPLG
jgi:uncharacterized membrane protein YsdA (DUF1294 family)